MVLLLCLFSLSGAVIIATANTTAAKAEEITLKVDFVVPDYVDSVESMQVKQGTTIELPILSSHKNGYGFHHWEDSKGNEYGAFDTYTVNGVETFTAVYAPNGLAATVSVTDINNTTTTQYVDLTFGVATGIIWVEEEKNGYSRFTREELNNGIYYYLYTFEGSDLPENYILNTNQHVISNMLYITYYTEESENALLYHVLFGIPDKDLYNENKSYYISAIEFDLGEQVPVSVSNDVNSNVIDYLGCLEYCFEHGFYISFDVNELSLRMEVFKTWELADLEKVKIKCNAANKVYGYQLLCVCTVDGSVLWDEWQRIVTFGPTLSVNRVNFNFEYVITVNTGSSLGIGGFFEKAWDKIKDTFSSFDKFSGKVVNFFGSILDFGANIFSNKGNSFTRALIIVIVVIGIIVLFKFLKKWL